MMKLDIHTCPPLATHAFLLSCTETGQGVIIDPGQGSFEALTKDADKRKVKLQKILLTHSHWDHLIDLALFVDQLYLPVFVHEADSANVKQPGCDGLPLPFPCKGVPTCSFLHDGEEIHVGHVVLKVMHTPGHSPGGVCFYLAKERVLIAGDTLFKGTIGNLSLATADRNSMKKSLHTLAALPPDVCVYPGHGEPTTIGAEQWIEQVRL